MKFGTCANTLDSNEPVSSLLRSVKTPADDILIIETKIKIHAANEVYSNVIPDCVCNGREDTIFIEEEENIETTLRR